ncbi:carbamate kinase [Ktedonosporobacter rubrisoli]|uniref:Carbamate kinase n=1 Tax=Ktedonosporobacter rubrisoli TaxID=2509675 RepID=A0A4P6K495_KTERU|nr:carbamate kinase [Ktedonosporobacter rubrisoli]QBD82753.1 carbamate kinase [Ktedonosporobacter rubrisoli]
MSRLAVIAIGGNSLVENATCQSVAGEQKALQETAIHIVEMILRGWQVVLTHGNGPQVGLILLQAEIARKELDYTISVDIAVAESQGSIGYALQQALSNELRRRSLNKQVVALLTHTLVDPDDPAFQQPSKPIGPFYTATEAEQKQREYGWAMMEDAGRGWRRAVPSPHPCQIMESEAIAHMLQAGLIVISAGGGGIPVIIDTYGTLIGTQAVIDKDLASSLLASTLQADLLLISTGVEKVALNYHGPNQQDLSKLTLSEILRYFNEGHFARGSMEPKICAAIEYLQNGGKAVLITRPEAITQALDGKTGTWIFPDSR